MTFRGYLADQNVVLAFVKYLLALRSCVKLPEDPQQHLVDFFGNYRDPMWDNMEDMRDENEEIESNLPGLEQKIVDLEKQI